MSDYVNRTRGTRSWRLELCSAPNHELRHPRCRIGLGLSRSIGLPIFRISSKPRVRPGQHIGWFVWLLNLQIAERQQYS